MEIEIREGFHHSDHRASDYYFCSGDCTLAAVEAFIASQDEDVAQVSSEGAVSGNITAQLPVVAINSHGLPLNPRLRRH